MKKKTLVNKKLQTNLHIGLVARISCVLSPLPLSFIQWWRWHYKLKLCCLNYKSKWNISYTFCKLLWGVLLFFFFFFFVFFFFVFFVLFFCCCLFSVLVVFFSFHYHSIKELKKVCNVSIVFNMYFQDFEFGHVKVFFSKYSIITVAVVKCSWLSRHTTLKQSQFDVESTTLNWRCFNVLWPLGIHSTVQRTPIVCW